MSVGIVIPIGLVIVAILIGIDIYLATDGSAGNTWSEILRMWGRETPLVPWVCGVLSGHFFHPVDSLEPALGQPSSVALLVWLTCLVALVGVALSRAGYPVPIWVPFLPAFVVGCFLWPV